MSARLVTLEANTMARIGFVAAVSGEQDINLVGQATTLDEAVELIDAHGATVVVCGALGDPDPLQQAMRLRATYPRLGVVLIGPDTDEMLLAAVDAGLSGYVPSTARIAQLVSTIRHASAAPGSFTSTGLAAALSRREHTARVLAPREAQVLRLFAGGASDRDIAAQLNITQSTLRTYVARLYDKLGARNRKQAMDAATRLGLV
jgi:DNA-binding NarL/FixJ family response regulator